MSTPAYQKQWREVNREHLKKYFADYHSKHHEKRLTANRERYEKNKVQQLSKNKEYRDKNISEIRKKKQQYSKQNSAKIVKRVMEWCAKNPDRVKAYRDKMKLTESYKLKMLLKTKARRAKIRGNTIDPRGVANFYKMSRARQWVSCYWCQALIPGQDRHIDHIIPIARGGRHAIDNLCTSCCNCNLTRQDKMPSEFKKLPQMFMEI